MVKHIVLFKLKETLSQEEKLKVMNDFKAAIEALPAKIGFIRHIFVGLNANSAEKWDICLDTTTTPPCAVTPARRRPSSVPAGSPSICLPCPACPRPDPLCRFSRPSPHDGPPPFRAEAFLCPFPMTGMAHCAPACRQRPPRVDDTFRLTFFRTHVSDVSSVNRHFYLQKAF